MAAAIKWPPITFLGCENGAAGAAKTSTAVAPNDPRIKVISDWFVMKKCNIESDPTPMNDIAPLNKMFFTASRFPVAGVVLKARSSRLVLGRCAREGNTQALGRMRLKRVTDR